MQKKAAATSDEEEFLDDKANLDELSGDDEDEGTFRLGQADEVRLANQVIAELELSLALLEQPCPEHTCDASDLPSGQNDLLLLQEFHDYSSLVLKDDAQNRCGADHSCTLAGIIFVTHRLSKTATARLLQHRRAALHC